MARKLLSAALALGLFWAPAARASEAEKFVVTIVKVELKTADGRWITVLEPDKEVDLVNAEPTISFFNNQGRVPPDKYSNFRLTFSETIRFAGFHKHRFSHEGGVATLKGSAPKASDLPGEFTAFEEKVPTIGETSPAGTVTFKLDLDGGDPDDVMTMYGKRDFPTPIEIKKGSFVKLWFNLDLQDAVHYAWPGAFVDGLPANDVLYVLPPKEVTEFVVTADEREETVSPEGIVLEF